MTGAGGQDLRKRRIATSNGAEDPQHGYTDGTSKTRAIHVSNSKRNIFRFADLPAELKNRVYHLSLTSHATIHLDSKQGKNGRNMVCRQLRHLFLGLIPNLLLVNKATYAEGGSILYANKFSFTKSKGLFVFIASLSAMAQSWVQELTLKMSHNEDELMGVADASGSCDALLSAFTTLTGASNLTHLRLRLTVSLGDSSSGIWEVDDFAKLLFPHVHLWIEALARQKGSREKALEVIDIDIDHFYWPDGTYTAGYDEGDHDIWTSELRGELLWMLRI